MGHANQWKQSQNSACSKPPAPLCTLNFTCGEANLSFTNSYKYLGYMIHEHFNEYQKISYSSHKQIIWEDAFDMQIIEKYRNQIIWNLIWIWYWPCYEEYFRCMGFGSFEAQRVLPNRIMRMYLGVRSYAPFAATKLELDWIECWEKRWLNMLRLFNRINTMDNFRRPKNKLWLWHQPFSQHMGRRSET